MAGIADLRPPLEGFDVEADRRLALELHAAAAGATFEDQLRRYWAAQPHVAQRLVERFVTGDLIGADRAAAVAEQIEDMLGPGSLDVDVALEVGCGTAALGSVLAGRARWAVVSDVALSWLVLARQRLQEAGAAGVIVVAAAADRLPLDTASADLVVAADVVEHVPDAAAMVRECARVLRPGAPLWVSTPNRLSLTPEPHVRLWGVGFLPRRAGRAYVARFRGVDYGDVHTLSLGALRRTLGQSDGPVLVTAPGIVAPQRARYSITGRALIGVYDRARRTPGLDAAVERIAPLYHGVTWAPEGPGDARRAGGRGSVPYFDHVAGGYDARYAGRDVGGHALRARRERVMELLADRRGRLLDVGCATGPMAPALTGGGFAYVGLDAAPAMVREAAALRGRGGGPLFATASAEALPVAGGSFDAAICIGVLERVPDQDLALRELGRAVRPGGVVLVSFPNRTSPYGVWRGWVWYPTVALAKNLAARLTGRPPGQLLLSPVHHWTPREAAARLADAVGPVDAVVHYYFNLLPSPLDELRPGLAYRLAQRAESLRATRWRWLGAGFIVRATRR